jgi:hypothetical protein
MTGATGDELYTMVKSSSRGVTDEIVVVKVLIHWTYLPVTSGLPPFVAGVHCGVELPTENGAVDTRIPTARDVPAGCDVGFHDTWVNLVPVSPVSRTLERYVAGEE